MFTWSDVLKFTEEGNLEPDRRVELSDEEWRARLTPEQYRITRQKGTERAFSSEMCSLFEPGLYACVCCETLLFDFAFKVQAQFILWIDVIEVAIKGDFALARKESVIERLDANMVLSFEARDQAMQSLEGRVPPVEGQPAPKDTCQAVQGLLRQQMTQYLRQVRDNTRTQLQAFRR